MKFEGIEREKERKDEKKIIFIIDVGNAPNTLTSQLHDKKIFILNTTTSHNIET